MYFQPHGLLMPSSTDCILLPRRNLSNVGAPPVPNLAFPRSWCRRGAQNGTLRRISLRASVEAESKRSNKWAYYGGSIPAILQALELVPDLEEALEPWKTSINNKERTIILKEQTDWRRALEIFEWFKKKGCYEVNVIHYNVMLGILGRAQRWDLIGSLWTEMQSNAMTPTNSTYGTLMDSCCKGGRNRESLFWLGDMYKRGMAPDEVIVGIILQAYKKAGEFGKAGLFFKRWSSDMKDGFGDHKKYSLYTYNTLIDTYGKAGQLEEASDTFGQMLREGVAPDAVTFNTMIHVCGNHGRLEEVASLMAMMEELHCLPDTRTYNILISLYIKGDDITTAESYFSRMKAAALVPDTVSYRTLLYAYSIRSMVGKAEALVEEMVEQGLTIDEYSQSALTRMYVDAGMLEQSWTWFVRFQDAMSSECFSANIDAFGEHGHLALVEKAFVCCISRQKLSVLAFNVMIKAYGLAKKYDKACELADNMETYGIVPDSCSYHSLIQILSAAKLPKKAVYYVRKMQEAGLVSDCVPFSVVIDSLAKLGELEMAEELFEEMIRFGIQADIVVYSILINACAEAGNVQQAAKYVESMKEAGLTINSIICNSLIKLYTKAGHLREAREIYKHLNSFDDDNPNVYASNCMINLYSDHAMVTEAEEIFLNLKLKGMANEFSFAMMICLYKKVGRVNEACWVSEEMEAFGLLSDTLSYNTVIGAYASGGRMKDAAKSFQHMMSSDVPPNDITFKTLGEILLKQGVPKGAISNLESVRSNSAQIGLQEWLKAIRSIIRYEDTTQKHGVNPNLRGNLKVNSSVVGNLQCELGTLKSLMPVT